MVREKNNNSKHSTTNNENPSPVSAMLSDSTDALYMSATLNQEINMSREILCQHRQKQTNKTTKKPSI